MSTTEHFEALAYQLECGDIEAQEFLDEVASHEITGELDSETAATLRNIVW